VPCALCSSILTTLYIHPGRWHFVGREGEGDRNGPKTPDNTHPPTHPRARPARGRARTEPARNGGKPGRQEAPAANRGRPRDTPGSTDQTGTAPRARKERERKKEPTHPPGSPAERREGPAVKAGRLGAGRRHTGATLAYEGLRPAGGRSGATGRCGGRGGGRRRGEGQLSLVGLGLSANSTSRRCVQSVFARFRAVDAIVRAGFSVDREASNGRCVVRRAADVIAVCVVCGAVERSANLNGPEIAE
jgi:hypothetical protein